LKRREIKVLSLFAKGVGFVKYQLAQTLKLTEFAAAFNWAGQKQP